jgi:hypothetical protein
MSHLLSSARGAGARRSHLYVGRVTRNRQGLGLHSRVDGWTLAFRFPGDEATSSAWNATFTQTGAEASARNTNCHGTIPPGASQSLGFLGVWTSNDSARAGFRVNRTVCTWVPSSLNPAVTAY